MDIFKSGVQFLLKSAAIVFDLDKRILYFVLSMLFAKWVASIAIQYQQQQLVCNNYIIFLLLVYEKLLFRLLKISYYIFSNHTRRIRKKLKLLL